MDKTSAVYIGIFVTVLIIALVAFVIVKIDDSK